MRELGEYSRVRGGASVMDRIGVVRLAAATAALACSLVAASAGAQTFTSRSWTTFVVNPVTVSSEEQVAAPGASLLSQPVTATRAAQLDAEAPSLLGMGSAKTFPAGTKMFGVKVPDGWIYCAVAASTVKWLYSEWTACYQDADNDGAFEVVRNSGAPFNGIPLFVFQPGPPKKLPAPIPYTAIAYKEGPTVDLGFVWKPVITKVPRDAPPAPVTQLTVTQSMITGDKVEGVGRGKTFSVETLPQTLRMDGATITLLGLTPKGELRYRVSSAMPAQIQPLELVLTTSTYYYVVTY